MKLALSQPYFLPYLGSFQLIHAVDKYVSIGYLKYSKGVWYHRNRLIARNEGPRFFNIQLVSKSPNKSLMDIKVNPSMHWRNKLIKSIEQNYSKSSFFEQSIDLFVNIINSDIEALDEFNLNSMIAVAKHLEMTTRIERFPTQYLLIEDELKKKGETNAFEEIDVKANRIIEICKHENADCYINAIGGKALYSKEVFKNKGISLSFIQSKDIEYRQAWQGFEPNMSILDVLMNCGKERTKAFLSEYTLV